MAYSSRSSINIHYNAPNLVTDLQKQLQIYQKNSFSAVLNLIPYVGALIATVPVVIVALTVSPSIATWSVVIIVITQQIQENILSPIIYGKQLDIHPLTTVILLLIGAEYGLFLSDKIEDIID